MLTVTRDAMVFGARMLPRRDRSLEGDPMVGRQDGLDLDARIDRHSDS
jgi:hypothetical protein